MVTAVQREGPRAPSIEYCSSTSVSYADNFQQLGDLLRNDMMIQPPPPESPNDNLGVICVDTLVLHPRALVEWRPLGDPVPRAAAPHSTQTQ